MIADGWHEFSGAPPCGFWMVVTSGRFSFWKDLQHPQSQRNKDRRWLLLQFIVSQSKAWPNLVSTNTTMRLTYHLIDNCTYHTSCLVLVTIIVRLEGLHQLDGQHDIRPKDLVLVSRFLVSQALILWEYNCIGKWEMTSIVVNKFQKWGLIRPWTNNKKASRLQRFPQEI